MPARAYHKLFVHATWSAKHRESAINEQIESALKKQIENKAQELQIKLLKFGCTADHLHLLLKLQPTNTPCVVIKDLKGNSAHFINQEFKDKRRCKFEWQRGYGILSVSEKDIPFISQYIENQKEHHQKGTIEERLEDYGQD